MNKIIIDVIGSFLGLLIIIGTPILVIIIIRWMNKQEKKVNKNEIL